MKPSVIGFTLLLAGILTHGCTIAKAQNTTFSGRIQRVWEDGFQLDTGSRSINVDSDDICGDHTAHHISEGQQVTVSGEFDGGEFYAFSIQDTQGKALDGCAITKVQNTTFSGRIQRVWEDGFQLDTGSRSINVDSDDICGDHTAHHISESQQVTVSGEFDGGEFDAFSIQDTQGKALCR